MLHKSFCILDYYHIVVVQSSRSNIPACCFLLDFSAYSYCLDEARQGPEDLNKVLAEPTCGLTSSANDCVRQEVYVDQVCKSVMDLPLIVVFQLDGVGDDQRLAWVVLLPIVEDDSCDLAAVKHTLDL